MHLLKDQIADYQQWNLKFIDSFIHDLQNFESNKNTLSNYKKYAFIILDLDFYRSYYKDLSHMTDDELINHYNNYGKNEGRFISMDQI